MKKKFFISVLFLFCVSPGLLQALPPVSALYGPWGFTF